MSGEKFTKGPWVVKPEEVDRDYIRVRGDMPGGRFKVANVLTPVYDGVSDREAKETRANAALISAAPDLYSAVSLASRHAKRWPQHWNEADVAVLESALAKARGEQP